MQALASERLTDRQQAFIDAYLGEAQLNGVKAAELAGYNPSRIQVTASELRKRLKSYIDAELEARMISGREVLDRLAQTARNDASEFIELDPETNEAYVNVAAMKRAGKAHLIKGIKRTKYGQQIELVDPQPALELLAKHHGLLKDQLDIVIEARRSGSLLQNLSREELLALAFPSDAEEAENTIDVPAVVEYGEVEGAENAGEQSP